MHLRWLANQVQFSLKTSERNEIVARIVHFRLGNTSVCLDGVDWKKLAKNPVRVRRAKCPHRGCGGRATTRCFEPGSLLMETLPGTPSRSARWRPVLVRAEQKPQSVSHPHCLKLQTMPDC